MIHDVFKRGLEVASGIDYGTALVDANGKPRTVAPVVLLGDDEAIKAVVRITPYSRGYAAGVLAFWERDLPRTVKRRVIRRHLRAMFPGIHPVRLAVLYVEHKDTEHLHIHWWVACMDLKTGKRLQPYWDRADRRRFRLWNQAMNDIEGLADPNSPKHWRVYSKLRRYTAPEDLDHKSEKRRELASHEAQRAKLLEMMEVHALAGAVRSRADVEGVLKREGWTITRRSKRFLSVTAQGAKKPIRLEGRVFAVDFNGVLSDDERERLARAYRARRIERLRNTLDELVPLIRKRTEDNRKDYGADYEGDDPLIGELIADLARLELETQRATPQDLLASMQANLAALQQRVGPGTPLAQLNRRTRQNLKHCEQVRAAEPTNPTHRPGGPRL